MSELVRDITGQIQDSHLEFWIQDEDKKWAEDFLNKHNLIGKKIVVLHPGCGAKHTEGARAREWPKENFIELGNILSRTYDVQVLITGGKDELKLSEEIACKMENKPLVLSDIDIGKFAALLKYCTLIISGDTGIMHLAAAVNIKTISLFGPSDENRWSPLGLMKKIVRNNSLSCSPCQVFGIDKPKCKEFNCMRSITLENVLNNINHI